MKIAKRFAESMAELRAAESTSSPDAALIFGCDRFEELWLKWKPSVLAGDENRLKLNPEIDELIALGSAISSVDPVSAVGRRAIGHLALMTLEAQGDLRNSLAAAAVRSYLANDSMGEDPTERSLLSRYRALSDDEQDEIRHFVWRKFKRTNRR